MARVFLTLLLAVAVAVVAPAIYLSRSGGLKGLLEARLSDSLGGVPVSVGDVGFELRMQSMHLTLLAYDVALSLDGSSITVPQASADFAPGGLVSMTPSEIGLSGADLDVTIGDDSAATSPVGLLAALLAPAHDSGSMIQRPRQLRVDSSSFTVRSRDPAAAAQQRCRA